MFVSQVLANLLLKISICASRCLTQNNLASLARALDRFNLVIGHYLVVHISIGRSAELLGMRPPKM